MNFGNSIEIRSRYNRQLQPWNPIKEQRSRSTSRSKFVDDLGTFHKKSCDYPTPPHKTVPSYPLMNDFSEVEKYRFPDLINSFENAPDHAIRTALYTRHTPYEWNQNTISNYNESDTKRNFSERMRNDIIRCMRKTDEKTTQAQRDTGRRIGERITDTTFWRNELNTEVEKLINEMEQLNNMRRRVERSLQGTEGPLHVVQECLYHREKRQGIELVHDEVEQSLLKEMEELKICQNNFHDMLNKTNMQMRDCRSSQHELETDIRNKEAALNIDTHCHQLNNFSRGMQYFKGIEKYDPTTSVPPTWAEASTNIVRQSQMERTKSSQLRSDAENLINTSASNIWDNWTITTNSFAKKTGQTLEMKNKLQLHLHKVQQEIFDIEKTIQLLTKAIEDKRAPMKVAQTRLQARTNRPHLDKCRDDAHNRLVQEVCELQESIAILNEKLMQAESNHQELLQTQASLEFDLHNKMSSLFIDRDQCGGIRRGYPVTASIQY